MTSVGFRQFDELDAKHVFVGLRCYSRDSASWLNYLTQNTEAMALEYPKLCMSLCPYPSPCVPECEIELLTDVDDNGKLKTLFFPTQFIHSIEKRHNSDDPIPYITFIVCCVGDNGCAPPSTDNFIIHPTATRLFISYNEIPYFPSLSSTHSFKSSKGVLGCF